MPFVGHLKHGDENLASELSVATGLIGLSLLVAAFTLPSRVRSLASHFGIEVVLRTHRSVALIGTAFIFAHIGLLLAGNPSSVKLLNVAVAPPRARAAEVSTVALIGLVVLGLVRRRRRPRYEGWRLVHITLAATVLVAAGLHVWWLQNLAVRRWIVRPLRMRRRSYVIEEIRRESPTVVTVVLHAYRHAGLSFRPGQFAWVKFGGSPFVFEEHPFTIASTAERPGRLEFTIKALGDLTELLRAIRPGRHVYVDGPYGAFTIDGRHAAGFVFIAGGVGVTPMLSMLRTLADRGDRRRHVLVVAARAAEDLLLADEIAELCGRLDLTAVAVMQDAPADWDVERGRITTELLAKYLPGPRHRRRWDYFICGSPSMVTSVVAMLDQLGAPRPRVHTEQFDMV